MELRTKRLLARPILMEDVDFIFSIRSDENTMRYIERPVMHDISEAVSLCANILEMCREKKVWFWIIENSINKAKVGSITIWNIDTDNNRAELGFMMHKSYTQMGYMKEAGKQVCNFAFEALGLHSVEAHTRPENVASIKTLESLGFTKDGCLRQNVFFNEKYWDTCIFTRLDDV